MNCGDAVVTPFYDTMTILYIIKFRIKMKSLKTRQRQINQARADYLKRDV